MGFFFLFTFSRYMGHVPPLPAVLPIDGSSGSSKTMQVPLLVYLSTVTLILSLILLFGGVVVDFVCWTMQAPNFASGQSRPSRCVTHCYIAKNIFYHQQIAKMNPFWPAAAGTVPLYGAKPYNLNAIPPSESTSIPANSLPANFPGRNSGALTDKGSHPSREKSSTAANTQIDTAQRKQHPMQQLTPPASVNNLLVRILWLPPLLCLDSILFHQPKSISFCSMVRPSFSR